LCIIHSLRSLLAATGWQGKGQADRLTLWLPTDRFGPVPSPDLVHDWETDSEPPDLLPWLHALFATRPAVSASPAQMQHFTGSFRAWERALTITGNRSARPTLKLPRICSSLRGKRPKPTYSSKSRYNLRQIRPLMKEWP
jgi:hypothetical protein